MLTEKAGHDGFDYECPIMSLPFALGTRLGSIPSWPAYIKADPMRCAGVNKRLGRQMRLRGGIVWSGNPQDANDHKRSVSYTQIAPLLLEGVDWFALHKEVRPKDAADLAAHGRVRHLTDEMKTFSDTAALLNAMDLVITVDTSIAHLAGAMGKPVWILLPFSADWRWFMDRSDSPWYPSARLFRQHIAGDWLSVIEEVKLELTSLLRTHPPVGSNGLRVDLQNHPQAPL